MTAGIARDGAHLSDPSIVVAHRSSAFVAVPDSLLLSILKLIVPNAWGAFVANLVTLVSFALFIYASVIFLQLLSFGWAESVAAITLFLLLPIGLEPRFSAPFDLGLALLIILPVLGGSARPFPFVASAFIVGLCNTANGYELAALIAVLRAFNLPRAQLSNAVYGASGALAIIGSIVAALLVKGMAPDSSLREAWWYAQEIPRIIWAEGSPVWWLAIVLFAFLAIAGFYALARARLVALLWSSLALTIGAAILAIPTQFGGVPLISLARVLQVIAPAGWPTARFLELASFALTLPVAHALSLFLGSLTWRARLASTVVWTAALIVFLLCIPRSPATVLPPETAHAAIVEFPIAEAGSRAGLMYAQDLLTAKARVLQPLVFLDARSPLDLTNTPEQHSVINTMRNAGVRFVILRSDIYAKPEWRTVEPRLFSPAFSAEPSIDAAYPWKIITYTPPGAAL